MANRLHKDARVTRRLTTLILLAVTLLGSHAPASSAPNGTSVLVFIDFSGSIQSTSRAAYRRELERDILPTLAPGDRIVIAAIHDKTLTAFRQLTEATLPTTPEFNGWTKNVLKHQRHVKDTEKEVVRAREELNADVKDIFSRPYASPYTDIFSSLFIAQKIFDGDPRKKVLILMSDMIEDYPPYKFDGMKWKLDTTTRVLDELQAKRQIPDLTGVCVSLATVEELRAGEGVEMTTSGGRWHSISETDRKVYHDDPRCPEGSSVEGAHRREGTEGRRKCEQCGQQSGLGA